MKEIYVPISDKYCLTLKEGSLYFGIGINKLRDILNEHHDLVIMVGGKRLINKKKMEKYIDDRLVI